MDKAPRPGWWCHPFHHRRLPRHPPVTTQMPPRWTDSPDLRSSARVLAGGPGSRGAVWQHVCHSAAGTRRSPPGAECPSHRSLSRGSMGQPSTCPEKGKTVREILDGEASFPTGPFRQITESWACGERGTDKRKVLQSTWDVILVYQSRGSKLS